MSNPFNPVYDVSSGYISVFSIFDGILYYNLFNTSGANKYSISDASSNIPDVSDLSFNCVCNIDSSTCWAGANNYSTSHNWIFQIQIAYDPSGLPYMNTLESVDQGSGSIIEGTIVVQPTETSSCIFYYDSGSSSIATYLYPQQSSGPTYNFICSGGDTCTEQLTILSINIQGTLINGTLVTNNGENGFFIGNISDTSLYAIFDNSISQRVLPMGTGISMIGSTFQNTSSNLNIHFFGCDNTIWSCTQTPTGTGDICSVYVLNDYTIIGLTASSVINNNFTLISFIAMNNTTNTYNFFQLDLQQNLTLITSSVIPVSSNNIPLSIIFDINGNPFTIIHQTGHGSIPGSTLNRVSATCMKLSLGATGRSFAPAAYIGTYTNATIVPSVVNGMLLNNVFNLIDGKFTSSSVSSTNSYPNYVHAVFQDPNTYDLHAFDNYCNFYHYSTTIQDNSGSLIISHTVNPYTLSDSQVQGIQSCAAFTDAMNNSLLYFSLSAINVNGYYFHQIQTNGQYSTDQTIQSNPVTQYADGTSMPPVIKLKTKANPVNNNKTGFIVGITNYVAGGGLTSSTNQYDYFFADYMNNTPIKVLTPLGTDNYPHLGLDGNTAINTNGFSIVDGSSVFVFVQALSGENVLVCFAPLEAEAETNAWIAYQHTCEIVSLDATTINGEAFIIAFLDISGNVYQYDGTIEGGGSILMYTGLGGPGANLTASLNDTQFHWCCDTNPSGKMLNFVPIKTPLSFSPPWFVNSVNYITPLYINSNETMPYNASMVDGYNYGIASTIGDDMALFYTPINGIQVGPIVPSNVNPNGGQYVNWTLYQKNSNFVIHNYNMEPSNNNISYFTNYVVLENVGYMYRAWIPITNPATNTLTINPTVSYYFEVSVMDNSGGIATGYNCSFNIVCVANCQEITGYTGTEQANQITWTINHIPQVISRYPVPGSNIYPTTSVPYAIEYGISAIDASSAQYPAFGDSFYWKMSYFVIDIEGNPTPIYDVSFNLSTSNTAYPNNYDYRSASLFLGSNNGNLTVNIEPMLGNVNAGKSGTVYPIQSIQLLTLRDTTTSIYTEYSFLLSANTNIPVGVFQQTYGTPAVSIFANSNYPIYIYSVPLPVVSYGEYPSNSGFTNWIGYYAQFQNGTFINNQWLYQGPVVPKDEIGSTINVGDTKYFPVPTSECLLPWGMSYLDASVNDTTYNNYNWDPIIYIRINPTSGTVTCFSSMYTGNGGEFTIYSGQQWWNIQNEPLAQLGFVLNEPPGCTINAPFTQMSVSVSGQQGLFFLGNCVSQQSSCPNPQNLGNNQCAYAGNVNTSGWQINQVTDWANKSSNCCSTGEGGNCPPLTPESCSGWPCNYCNLICWGTGQPDYATNNLPPLPTSPT